MCDRHYDLFPITTHLPCSLSYTNISLLTSPLPRFLSLCFIGQIRRLGVLLDMPDEVEQLLNLAVETEDEIALNTAVSSAKDAPLEQQSSVSSALGNDEETAVEKKGDKEGPPGSKNSKPSLLKLNVGWDSKKMEPESDEATEVRDARVVVERAVPPSHFPLRLPSRDD